jgi:hypothetical protein
MMLVLPVPAYPLSMQSLFSFPESINSCNERSTSSCEELGVNGKKPRTEGMFKTKISFPKIKKA